MSMLDNLQPLFSAAERDADWNMHLETFQEMLWYDRAYDDYKYFTWGFI